jgi:hypothetical protein
VKRILSPQRLPFRHSGIQGLYLARLVQGIDKIFLFLGMYESFGVFGREKIKESNPCIRKSTMIHKYHEGESFICR